MSWTLTPNVKTLLKSILPNKVNNLYDLSKENFRRFFMFISKMKSKYPYPLMGNILIFDFVDFDLSTNLLLALLGI